MKKRNIKLTILVAITFIINCSLCYANDFYDQEGVDSIKTGEVTIPLDFLGKNNPGTSNPGTSNPGGDGNAPGDSTPGGDGDEGTTEKIEEEENEEQVGNKLIRYKYKYSANAGANSVISFNAFDMKGKSILNGDVSFSKNNKYKAGTWIGLRAVESQSSSWRLYPGTFEYKEIQIAYTCTYIRHVARTCRYTGDGPCPTHCVINNLEGICYCTDANDCGTDSEIYTDHVEEEYFVEHKCKTIPGYTNISKSTEVEVEKEIDNSPEINEKIDDILKKEAKRLDETAKSAIGGPSVKIKYLKIDNALINNQLCKENPNSCYGYIEGKSKYGIKVGPSDGTSYGSYSAVYEYLEENVCINVKNSNVTYGRECNENEMKVENGVVYYDETKSQSVKFWHYFLPLNAKTGDDIWIEVENSQERNLNINECESLMKYFSDINQSYRDYISPIDTIEIFKGDYKQYGRHSEDYLKLEEVNGCKISAKIILPISQEFYNETTTNEGNKKFKGFNFYYKPININDPFPNGLTNTSLWKDWYNKWKNEQKVSPNISDSFNEVTYIATNIDTAKVRNYTKNNPYTSWKNISLGGRSSFIENENIVMRNEDVSFYKLGCGPYNSDWSECKQ